MMTFCGCLLPETSCAALAHVERVCEDQAPMRSAFWLNLAVKGSLVLLLAFGAFSGLERFAGKAFGWRLVGYSIAALIVPALWAARGRRPPYPFVVDTLFVLPFLID